LLIVTVTNACLVNQEHGVEVQFLSCASMPSPSFNKNAQMTVQNAEHGQCF
jgi:hypothetical protein